jgi:protein O-mannosyl-transferase
MSINRNTLLHLFLISSLVLIVFGNSLLNGFVWDDHSNVVDNQIYKEFNLEKIFFSLSNGLEYLPLRDLTYAIDYALWEERAAGFHLTNLLLYLANIIVVYFLVLEAERLLIKADQAKLPENSAVALFTALFFAVHPIQCQAVNFITCRNVILSGFFSFLSCLLFLRFLKSNGIVRVWYYAGALGFFLCALLSKATTLVLPAILILFVLAAVRDEVRRDRLKKLFSVTPFLLLSLAFFIFYREVGLRSNVIPEGHSVTGLYGLSAKVATAVQIPFFYLGKFLVPTGFVAEYDIKFGKLFSLPALTALAALVIMMIAAIKVRKRFQEPLFALCWFLLALLPVLNFFSTNPVVADRYAFVPVFGLCFFCAASLTKLLGNRILAQYVIGVVLIVYLSLSAFAHNKVWHDDKSLWKDALEGSPGSMKAYTNLGWAYYHEGDFANAFSVFAGQQELAPNDINYDLARGYLHFQRHEWGSAVDTLSKALLKKEDSLYVLYLMGQSYESMADYDKAAEFFNRILLSSEPDSSGYKDTARANLRRLFSILRPQLDKMRTLLADDPLNQKKRWELAKKLEKLGVYDEALRNYLTLERSGMKDWRLFYNIANMYGRLRQWQNAIHYYQNSLELNRASADTYRGLVLTYKSMKEYPLAINAFNTAVSLDNTNVVALFNLAITYQLVKNWDSALHTFQIIEKNFPDQKEMVRPYIRKLESS